MADENDFIAEVLGEKVLQLYIALVAACASIPATPIMLPTPNPERHEALNVASRTVTDAVRRVIDIADELPVSEEVLRGVFSSCVYWTMAVDMLGLQIANPEVNRGPAVTAAIVNCEQSLAFLEETLDDLS